jgi:hypothetical protein
MKEISPLLKHCSEYLGILDLLSRRGLLGRLTIYPAIGVDCLTALSADLVIGLNLHPYDNKTILDYVSQVVSADLLPKLAERCSNNLSLISGIDASRANLVQKRLQSFTDISPKALLLKNCYEYLFMMDWDLDDERFYKVSADAAQKNASCWIDAMIDWLSVNDLVLAFDKGFFPFLSNKHNLAEIDIGLAQISEESDRVYKINNVPVIFFPNYVRVFVKQSRV